MSYAYFMGNRRHERMMTMFRSTLPKKPLPSGIVRAPQREDGKPVCTWVLREGGAHECGALATHRHNKNARLFYCDAHATDTKNIHRLTNPEDKL